MGTSVGMAGGSLADLNYGRSADRSSRGLLSKASLAMATLLAALMLGTGSLQ